jgi:hypothetical protein
MAKALALAFLFLVMTAGEAQATTFRVVAVPGLGLDDLTTLEQRGAVGLLVPGAGPETSAEAARAALVRGEARNSLRGAPTGPVLIELETAAAAPTAGPVIVVGLPSGGTQPNDRRYPVAVIGSGYRGVLTSDSTRIPGLVSIADIAPTATGADGGLRWREEAEPSEQLLALDQRIDENNSARLLATILTAAALVALALVRPRAALLGFGLGLAANLALGIAGVSVLWAVLTTIGIAIIAGGLLLGHFVRSGFGVGVFLAVVVAAYLLALGIDGAVVALSPLGPTQNSRFYGISNLLETLFLVPALAGSALMARRAGVGGFVVVALASFIAVAGSAFGADGGGAIVLAVGFSVLAVLLYNLRGYALFAGVAAVLGAAAAVLALDSLLGPSTHVTTSVGSGASGLAEDVGERIVLSWERIVHSPAVAVVVVLGVAVSAVVVSRILRSEGTWAERAVPLAVAAAIVASLVVNDSPNDVALAGVVGLIVCDAAMLRDRCAAASCSRSPSAFSWPAVAGRKPSRPPPRP